MQTKLLHNLVEEMAGEGNGRIVEILFKKKNVNEFLIAKKMELTINQVRNILYKLSADNLVSFIRKKDKRKGWYIYYWTLNTEKCLAKLESSLVEKIAVLKGLLNNRETRRFYVCKSCDIEVGEEKALENGFSCEECAEIYELSDNSKPIREVKTRITRTTKNLLLIQKELENVRKRMKIAQKRITNKLEKEKKARADLLKAARAAARKKVAEAKKKASGNVGTEKKITKGKGKTETTKKKAIRKKVVKGKGKISRDKQLVNTTKKKINKKTVVKKVSLASKLKKKFSGGK